MNYLSHLTKFILFRTQRICQSKGLLRSVPSIVEKCLPPENQIHDSNRDKNINKKNRNNLSNPNKKSISKRKSTNDDQLFGAYDYIKLREKIRLPLKTMHGIDIDENFVQKLETIFKWCNKSSSLSSLVSQVSSKSDIEFDLSFDEILIHVLEGLLPNLNFTSNETDFEEDNQSTNDYRFTNLGDPYDVLDARNSPIYAEIPDMNLSDDIPIRGKFIS